MRPVKLIYISVLLAFVGVVIFSCQKFEIERELKIENDSIYNVGVNYAIAIASIKDIGNGVSNHGHCWSKNQNPTILDEHTDFGLASKALKIESHLENLEPATQYFIRPFATDRGTFKYGEEISFYTDELGSSSIKTGNIRYEDSTSIFVLGEIITLGEGVDSIYQYGHCWATTKNPTILDLKTELSVKTTTGEFSSNISGLKPLTDYYIKAYAVTESGTSYGEEVTARIYGQLPEVELLQPDSITAHAVYYSANINTEQDFAIIERGICISMDRNPTKENSGIINGNNTGTYNGTILNLERATTYYMRAYAVNVNGIGYSDEIEIKTLPELPTIETMEVTDITTNSARSGGIIIDDGGEDLIEKGICWSTNKEPTISDNIYVDNSNSTEFTAILTNLHQLTGYNIRAYAINTTGISYGQTLKLSTDYEKDTATIKDDRDGQSYKVVKIGTQWWMAENLNHYHQGSFYYNFDSVTYADLYGRLYTFHYTISDDLCPAGWHIPTNQEWNSLANHLDGVNIAGGKLKQKGLSNWMTPNTGANNESGFNALPAGYAPNSGGDMDGNHNFPFEISTGFQDEGTQAKFLEIPTQNNVLSTWILRSNSNALYYNQEEEHYTSGVSIRCIKD